MLVNIIFIYLIIIMVENYSIETYSNDSYPYNHCWSIGDDKTPCNMNKHLLNTHASCIWEFSETTVVNKKCGICHWRHEKDSPLCKRNNTINTQCCCDWPGCNKQIYLDAQVAFLSEVSMDYNSCYYIGYNTTKEETWNEPKSERCETRNENSEDPVCKIEYTTNSSNTIIHIQMGCATAKEAYVYSSTCREINEKDGNKRIKCICKGHNCTQKIYREHLFDQIMDIRLKNHINTVTAMNESIKAESNMNMKLFTENKFHQNYKKFLVWIWVGFITGFSVFISGMFACWKVKNVEHKSFSSQEDHDDNELE